MSLKILPADKNHLQNWKDKFLTEDDHVDRRVYCDGCDFSMAFKADQWVFPESQVMSWAEEHKDCGDVSDAKRKGVKVTDLAKKS